MGFPLAVACLIAPVFNMINLFVRLYNLMLMIKATCVGGREQTTGNRLMEKGWVEPKGPYIVTIVTTPHTNACLCFDSSSSSSALNPVEQGDD